EAELRGEPGRLRLPLGRVALEARVDLRRARGDDADQRHLPRGRELLRVLGVAGEALGTLGTYACSAGAGLGEALPRDGVPRLEPTHQPAPLRNELALLLADGPVQLELPELAGDPVGQVCRAAGVDSPDAKLGPAAVDPFTFGPGEAAERADASRAEELVREHRRGLGALPVAEDPK